MCKISQFSTTFTWFSSNRFETRRIVECFDTNFVHFTMTNLIFFEKWTFWFFSLSWCEFLYRFGLYSYMYHCWNCRNFGGRSSKAQTYWPNEIIWFILIPHLNKSPVLIKEQTIYIVAIVWISKNINESSATTRVLFN